MTDDAVETVGDLWDRRYRSAPRLFRPDPDETLVELVSPLPPGTAIDLGAGEGRNSLWLARNRWMVTAVDASGVALERLQDAAIAEGLEIDRVRADLLDHLASVAALRERFDLVVLAFVQAPPEARRNTLLAAAEAVTSGGHLLVVGHHLSSLGRAGPPDPALLYTEDELAKEVHGLEVLRLELRSGASDVTDPGVDVVLWARRSTGD